MSNKSDDIIKLAAIFYQFPSFKIKDFFVLQKSILSGKMLLSIGQNQNISEKLKSFLSNNRDWLSRVNEDFLSLKKIKAKIIYPGHKFYPESFYQSQTPPIILSYFGNEVWLRGKGLAVVGSREPSTSCLKWMDLHLTELIKENNLFIVSGGARGIDQKAHSICLKCNKPTVAFLPSGLSNIYPSDFSSWVARIIESGGAVISEFSPRQRMYKSHFQQRNRLIASLTETVFVVEARRKSGSIMTAGLSLKEGRNVCTLPGRPDDRHCAGSVDLLFDGAQLIRDSRDLSVLVDGAKNYRQLKFF